MARFSVQTTRARGFTEPDGRKQIAFRLTAPMFEELKSRAVKECRSIQDQMLNYIELGLQVDRDCEEDEPFVPSNRTQP
jgi:hypothetical protein